MGCYKEQDFLDFLRGQMDPEIIEEFERHIEECDQCAARLYRIDRRLRLWGI